MIIYENENSLKEKNKQVFDLTMFEYETALKRNEEFKVILVYFLIGLK